MRPLQPMDSPDIDGPAVNEMLAIDNPPLLHGRERLDTLLAILRDAGMHSDCLVDVITQFSDVFAIDDR